MNRIHSMPAIVDASLSPSSMSSNDSAPARLKAAVHRQHGEQWRNQTMGQSMSYNNSSNSLMSYTTGSSPPPRDRAGSFQSGHSSGNHPYMMSGQMMHPHGQNMYMHPSNSSPPMSMNPSLSQSTPPTYTVIPATVTTASIVPSNVQPMQASKKMRKNSKIRSPGTKRVPLWDTVRNKKLSGFASPMEKNLKKYLEEHPNCVLYDKNLAAQHKMSMKYANGEVGSNPSLNQTVPGINENSENDSDDEMPPELERIISSNDLQGIHSAQSHSPNSPAMTPFNQPMRNDPNGSGRMRFPPPLSSSLPLQQSTVPDPDQLLQQKQQHNQQRQPHPSHSQQQHHMQPHNSTMSPMYSPITHGIQRDFEALTVNSLDLRVSPSSSRKARRNHGQLRSSSVSQMSSQPINLPPNHSPHIRSHPHAMHGFAMHPSSSSTSLASYDSHEQHAALSSSVPVSSSLPMHMHHSMHHAGGQSGHRPPAVDTRFAEHQMHEHAPYSSVLQSINPPNGQMMYSEGPASGSTTPRGGGVLRKNRSSNFYHQRVHPYSDRNSPRLGSSLTHSVNERLADDDPYSGRLSHSLPRNLPHSLPAPSFHEMFHDQNQQPHQKSSSNVAAHPSVHERDDRYDQHRQPEGMHDSMGIPVNHNHAVQSLDHHLSQSVPANTSYHSQQSYHQSQSHQYQPGYSNDQSAYPHESYEPRRNSVHNQHVTSTHQLHNRPPSGLSHMMKHEYYQQQQQHSQHPQSSSSVNPSSRSVSSESSMGSSRKRVSPSPANLVKTQPSNPADQRVSQTAEHLSDFMSPVHSEMDPIEYHNDFGLHFDAPVTHSHDQQMYPSNHLVSHDHDRQHFDMSPPAAIAPVSPIPLTDRQWSNQSNHQDNSVQATSVYQLNYNDEHYDQLALQRQHEFFAFDGFM